MYKLKFYYYRTYQKGNSTRIQVATTGATGSDNLYASWSSASSAPSCEYDKVGSETKNGYTYYYFFIHEYLLFIFFFLLAEDCSLAIYCYN